jgi:hypothetical protein
MYKNALIVMVYSRKMVLISSIILDGSEDASSLDTSKSMAKDRLCVTSQMALLSTTR